MATWFDLSTGCMMRQRTTIHRFKTLEQAERYAKGKKVNDIYVSKGEYAVDVIVTEVHDDDEGRWYLKED